MRRNYCIVFFSLLVLVFLACSKKTEVIVGPRTILNVPPDQMRDVLNGFYRLGPDKRFLHAVADIHHFYTGEKREPVLAQFEDGRWNISYKGKQVGTLPELPDFSDFMSLLSQWSQELNKRYTVSLSSSHIDSSIDEINRELSQFLSSHAIAAAHQADLLWNKGQHDPVLLYAATQALVTLAVQQMDRLENGDELLAHALSTLVITKTLTQNKCVHEEALLAYTMGYSTYAASIGSALPQSDPVGAYVVQDDQRLSQLAEAENSTVESHYLFLLNLSKKKDVKSFASWVSTYFPYTWLSLPVYKTALEMDKFSLTPALSRTIPQLVLLALAQDAGTMPDLSSYMKDADAHSDGKLESRVNFISEEVQSQLPTVIAKFESGLQKTSQKYRGPFLDADTYNAYYKGYFFSSFYTLGLHYMDALCSQDASAHFAAVLGKSNTGIASDLRTWYNNLVRSKEGRINLAELSSQIKQSTSLGAAPFMRTLAEQKTYYGFGDPALLKAIKDMMPYLDTRIKHRLYLSDLAYTGLLDLKLTERLTVSALKDAASQNRYAELWYANLTGDTQKLTGLFNSSADLATRVHSLEYLEKQKDADRRFIEKGYRQLLNEAPDDWDASWSYADYLKRIKKYPEARRVLNNWLKRKVVTMGLEDISCRARIARIYYEERLYKQGWKEVEPVIQSQKGDALCIAALLLDKLGRTKDAEKIGRFLVDRYPDSPYFRFAVTGIYWRHDKYDEAADLLKSAVHKVTIQELYEEISPRFAEIFKDKPEQAMSAFQSLVSRGFDPIGLLGIPRSLSKVGKNNLAFRLCTQLKVGGLEKLVFLVESYKYLKAYKTRGEAINWLRAAIPPQMINPTSMISYDEGQFDLLWEFTPAHAYGESFFWLARTAASLGNLNDPHHQELINYYSGGGKGDNFIIGKFLMGLASEKDVLATATDTRKRCEVAYYIGLKAQKDGRYQDASDWFRISVETGLMNVGEYRWSYDALYRWYKRGETMERIAAEKL
jgi:hypothetical protein